MVDEAMPYSLWCIFLFFSFFFFFALPRFSFFFSMLAQVHGAHRHQSKMENRETPVLLNTAEKKVQAKLNQDSAYKVEEKALCTKRRCAAEDSQMHQICFH